MTFLLLISVLPYRYLCQQTFPVAVQLLNISFHHFPVLIDELCHLFEASHLQLHLLDGIILDRQQFSQDVRVDCIEDGLREMERESETTFYFNWWFSSWSGSNWPSKKVTLFSRLRMRWEGRRWIGPLRLSLSMMKLFSRTWFSVFPCIIKWNLLYINLWSSKNTKTKASPFLLLP